LLPQETHRLELRLIRRFQENFQSNCNVSGLAFTAIVINTGVWRSRRRVIDPDKVKLRALVNEKHELSIGPVASRGLLCNFGEVTSRYTKLQNLSFSKTISTSR